MALSQQQLLPPRREAAALARRSVAQRHSDQAEMWLGRAEFKELIHPPLAGTIEALRSDIKTTARPVQTPAEARGPAGADVRPPAPIQVPQPPFVTTSRQDPPMSRTGRVRRGDSPGSRQRAFSRWSGVRRPCR
jgi:hypothetical protein